ncbi:Sterol 3-beta-glucosyltransferase [Lachnellula hyalina]|uniref:Sterol 3-beta-glucosyltransferase n=1 Tax=Lachnellula hyalina TaxID=1316788 RepID=A0A8H8R641_9HELO|nr:Sterol 3-beta-glucosyltransferase [Lachnellula hyalina]TVY28311.1 Sterol 3-beta-glucosyltransferase [Lachnellula hyalina]
MASKPDQDANQENALPAALIAQAEAAIIGSTGSISGSRRTSRASQRASHGGESSSRAHGTHLTVPQDSETEAPPAYGDSHDQIELSQDGFDTKANVTDDGRINININQKTRKLSDLLVPALRNQLKLVAQEEKDTPLPPGYIPPALGGLPGQTPPPHLNIVIHVVGSRGDVQPFVALGKTLKATYGHRVRLATHPTFQTFVEENGLEFFSIGGDPSELMAFMVKNPGLMPGFDSLKSGDVGKRRKGMEEIVLGCWRSCIEAGNGLGAPTRKDNADGGFDAGINMDTDPSDRPFIADAIIANPPSFAHVHIAEKMGIPLHMMFTMPWSPTQSFPHPLANIQSSNADVSMNNFVSYALVEMMTWQGLGDVINRFREHALGLEPISLIWAPGMLSRLRVPYTYCWSPALIPKPKDWGQYISISGFYFLSLASSYTPEPELAAFLAAGPPPVYIGFGSIVVDDPNAMTKMIFEAVKKAGVRALVSKGWGGLGADALGIPEGVFMLGNVPHDWLFQHVSCVVHHGGAGTTAAGIATGKPTVIVPFFGDQPFWGAMVARAGAGPLPIPYKQLTADKLAAALSEALKPETLAKAKELGARIKEEKGNEVGAKSFHDMLGVDNLRCSLAPNRTAVWRIKRTQTRLSAFAANVLANEGLLDFADLKLYRPKEYETDDGPWDPISGGASALLGTIGSMTMGMADFPIEIFRAARSKKDARLARKETTKDGLSGSDTIETSSRSRSQLDLAAEEAVESPAEPLSPRVSTSTLTLKTSHESAERSSSDTAGTGDTSLTSMSTERAGRGNALKEALRGTLSRTRSQSREGAARIGRSFSKDRSSTSRTASPGGARTPKEFDTSALTLDNAVGAGKGVARIVGAGLKSPMDFTLGIARGFHNAPKLYGDDTVRPHAKVTDFQSGVRAATKEFGFGFYDGITGLVTQPLRGAEKEGAAGLIKGIGKGIGGLILKPGAAIWAVPGYTFMGVHKEVRKLFGSSVLNYCISARTAQGFEEASRATPEERLDVIYRWTTHKAEYQNMKQKLFETGGPEGQGTGHLTPKGFLQTRHLSFEERKKLHELRRLKREEEQQNTHGAGAHKHCPFCRRDEPHLHTPRAVQDTPSVLDDPDRNDEFEHAIHASVAATSHGNVEQDMLIERAIRASIKELQSTETTLSDEEALRRAIQASVVESGHKSGFDGAGSSVDFTEEDAEHQTLLEKAIQESLKSYSLPASQPLQDIDTDDDEEVKLALKMSQEQTGPKPTDIDDALNVAIQKSKEEHLKEKTEEDIVLAYVKKQSMKEAEHKSNIAGKQKEVPVVEEASQSKADEEALRQAIEMSLKHAGGDGASGYS